MTMLNECPLNLSKASRLYLIARCIEICRLRRRGRRNERNHVEDEDDNNKDEEVSLQSWSRDSITAFNRTVAALHIKFINEPLASIDVSGYLYIRICAPETNIKFFDQAIYLYSPTESIVLTVCNKSTETAPLPFMGS
ncbi:hypothetical protein PHYBLDRAFT_171177 [Phycomyces blakesleeanus NRRL 1555(-)]|uniref:Uncharacterized protein n=1 Tax=Phycomyces blakesleeanus (strain ATCC 8743b / DSM 1359 / FGSC 10004 / NBRC 33097 / NRRL 1555) TaxID=763407 RepID=A0A167LGU1_PHYB8|nr:hypothetical protein PHYBLDRAFT_171177 [Phycomyces blakesleeanus NRRL 1555(-)]OAD70425.1 hypothetical protein PHYBLDRAFT_171177 [Phycomyces blakesleeanus NRRL 1555(-)]|eukprot:XP_018288465.1 hypothetical protein PHYBLDRAFT_171177 [Phycomyces blakesleeanus NRRL 1555(-)]